MVYPRQSYQTEAHSSLRVSGNSCMHLWVLSLFAAPPIILRPMVKLSELIKFWRICLEPVYSLTARNGMSAYLWQNFLTITVIKKASEWPRLRHYMDGGVELQ